MDAATTRSMSRKALATWSDLDHSGPVIIVAILCLVYWMVPGIGHQVILYGRQSRVSWASRLYIVSMV